MRKVVAVMILMFVVMVWPFGGIWYIILSRIVGGGVEQSYLYPLYAGIILLAGIVVACTVVIVDEIRKLRDCTNKKSISNED